MRILLVNVGNTCTTVASATNTGGVTVLDRRTGGFQDGRTAYEAMLPRWRRQYRMKDSVLCSVVPAQTRLWLPALARDFGRAPLVIGPQVELGVTLAYPRPQTIGADRLADVCAGVRMHGSPVLVVDIGTAATFNLVETGHRFVGGAIAPGPELFTRYLSERTAQLPHVDFPSGRIPRVGRSTRKSIMLAAAVGYRGMVTALVRHILGASMERAPVVYTGGNALKVVGHRDDCVVDPLLTLRGMAWAWELNRRQTA